MVPKYQNRKLGFCIDCGNKVRHHTCYYCDVCAMIHDKQNKAAAAIKAAAYREKKNKRNYEKK